MRRTKKSILDYEIIGLFLPPKYKRKKNPLEHKKLKGKLRGGGK